MFTSNHLQVLKLNQDATQEWLSLYFEDAVDAVEQAMVNSEHLGWLKILLGPKYVTHQYTNSYEILYLESDLHLNLVVYNVITQMLNSQKENRIFKSMRQKIIQGTQKNLPTLDEIAEVERLYVQARQEHLVGNENKLWFTLNTNTSNVAIVESKQHSDFYAGIFNQKDESKTNVDNIYYSYRNLFNRYAQILGAENHQQAALPANKFIAKIVKYFEHEKEALQVEYYKSWKDRVSANDYSLYNVKVSKRFAGIIQQQISAILKELSELDTIDLLMLGASFEKKVIALQNKLNTTKEIQQTVVEEYKSHVKYWMAVNKEITPKKYRNILPEYLASLIIKTKIHLVPQELFTDAKTGDTLLHVASRCLSKLSNSEIIDRHSNVISLLLEQGSNAFSENALNVPALNLNSGYLPQQLNWRLIKIQLENTAYVDPLLNLIAKELISYASNNDSVLKTVTHNAATKKTRLLKVIQLLKMMNKARFVKLDQSLVESLISLREGLKDESSALAKALTQIITEIESSDLSELVSLKKSAINKANINKQLSNGAELYLHHYERYRDNFNPEDISTKYNDLYVACIGLVDAAAMGNVEAQNLLITSSKLIMSFDLLEHANKEYQERLKQLLPIQDHKSHIYQRLAFVGKVQSSTKFYVKYQDRYHDIITTLNNRHLGKSDTLEDSSVDFNAEKALKILLAELVGKNLLNPPRVGAELDTDFKYFHRMLSREAYQKLVSAALMHSGKDEASVHKYMRDYDSFLGENFTVLSCQSNSNGAYHLHIDAVTIDAAVRSVIVFVDSKSGCEIARFEKFKNSIEFRAYGDAIHLKINGNLENSNYIFRNEKNSSINLTTNFSAKNLMLGVDAAQFIYNGAANISHSFNLEACGNVKLDADSEISATHSMFKSGSFELNGKVNVSTATLQVAQKIIVTSEGCLTADAGVYLFANSLNDMRGKIISNGSIKAIIQDAVYIHGMGNIHANVNLELEAKNIMATDHSTLGANNYVALKLNKSATFDKQTIISASNFLLQAPVIKNYSPNLSFDSADFFIKDVMTNYPTGVIKTKNWLTIRGESLWSGGQIEYGTLNVTLNKVFVLGLAERKDIYEYFKNIRNKPARPCIKGGNATIVTGLFLNLFSGVWTKNLTITALADIDLFGLTCATNTVKSRILAIDAGISVPNLPAIAEDLGQFFDTLSKGEYITAFSSLLSFNALFRASSFTRLLIRSIFPQIGKPVDFIWGGGSLVCALPGLCSQVKALYDLGGAVELHHITTLLSSLNSAGTQAMILESQSSVFSDGIGSIQCITPNLTALGLDVLSLALPSASSTSLININSGLEAQFSIQQRDFIACSRLNFWLAINASQTFYDMYDVDHAVFANNYSLTGNEAYLSGSVYGANFFANINNFFSAATVNVDREMLQVGHLKLLKDSKIDANELQATTTKTEIEGDVDAKHVIITATENITNHGNVQAQHGLIDAGKGTFDNQGTVKIILDPDAIVKSDNTDTATANPPPTDAKNDKPDASTPPSTPKDASSDSQTPPSDGPKDTPPVPDAPPPELIIKAHHLINEGEIIAEKETVALISDEKVEQKGYLNIDTVIEQSKDIDNSGTADVHKMLIKADEHSSLTGNIHLRATDKPGELDIIAPTNESSPDSTISGDGIVFVDTTVSSLGHVDVNELIYKEDDIKDEQDFIRGRGRWANIHVRDGLSLTSHNNLVLDQDINLNINLSINSNTLNILNNLHTSKSMNLVSSVGGIDVKRASVTADQTLAIKSNTYFKNDHGLEAGNEVYILAKGDILNQGGIWAAQKYMFVKSDNGSIAITCDESNVQGKFDVMKRYSPAYVFGGTGEGHEGIGLVMSAGKKIVVDGSVINSVGSNILAADEGIDILARHHSYESYYRHSKTWYGKSSTTVEYDNQVQASSIISQGGSNTLSSKNGYIYSCAGQFLSSHDNNFYAKNNITLLGMQLQKTCYKDNSWLGLIDHKTRQRDDENVPTFVINPENSRFISQDQDVNILNAYVQNGGTTDIFGRNVTIAAPVLNHYFSDESRGFGINSPLLSMPNNITSLWNDYSALSNSQNGIEFGANAWKLGLDGMNSVNGVIGGLRAGSAAQAAFPSSYLTSAQLSYTHSKTTANYQTVASNVGLNVGNLRINATDTLTFAGAPVTVANAAEIHAHHFVQKGLDLHSSMHTQSQSMSAGFALQGTPNVGGSYSESGNKSTYYFNQSFNVGGTLTMDVDKWDMIDANVNAYRLAGKVGSLSIVSDLNKTSSFSRSISLNTNGNFSGQVSNNDAGTIGTVSGIHTTAGTDLTAGTIDLTGAKITSDGVNNVIADKVTAHDVHEYNSGYSYGYSGNINNFTNPQPGVDWKQGIPTYNVSLGYQNYQAVQHATINGPDLHAGSVDGDALNISNSNGLDVFHNDHLNLQLTIPVFSKAGMLQLEDNLNWASGKLTPSSLTATVLDSKPRSASKDVVDAMYDDDDDLPDLIDDSDYEESDHKPEHTAANSGHAKAGSKSASTSKDSTDDKENNFTKNYFSDTSRQAKWRSALFSANSVSTDDESANDDSYLSDVAVKDGLKDKVFESSDEELAVPQEFKETSPQNPRSNPGAMDYVDAFNEGVEDAKDSLVDGALTAAKTAWDGLNAIGEATFGVTTQAAHERNMLRGKAVNDELQAIADDDASIPVIAAKGLGMLAHDKYNEFVNDDGPGKVKMITDGVASSIFGYAVGEAIGATTESGLPADLPKPEGISAVPGIDNAVADVDLSEPDLFNNSLENNPSFPSNLDEALPSVPKNEFTPAASPIKTDRDIPREEKPPVDDRPSFPADPKSIPAIIERGTPEIPILDVPFDVPAFQNKFPDQGAALPTVPKSSFNPELLPDSVKEQSERVTNFEPGTEKKMAAPTNSAEIFSSSTAKINADLPKLEVPAVLDKSVDVANVDKAVVNSGYNTTHTISQFHFLYEDNYVTRGSLSAARAWSMKERYKQTKLPNEGKVRYVPAAGHNPNKPFQRTPDKKGYIDRFENIWRKGGSKTPGEPFEWDVELSEQGKNQLGWAASRGAYLNVSLKGRITHKT